jgi:hypothetical protein
MDKRETVETRSVWGLPSDLDNFLLIFNEIKRRIPDEYQHTAEIEFEDDEIRVSYLRPETDGERRDRVERDAIKAKRKEFNELRTLDRLMKKYNKGGDV